MSIVFLNGEFVNEDEAKVSVNDTGYYFGDGIYEVILLYKGKLIDKDSHLDRLTKCFEKVYFKNVPSKEEILEYIRELIKRNPEIETGSVYMQFTRGCCPRSHTFAGLDLKPNCFMKINQCQINNTIKQWHSNLMEDPRRMRCDVKMISLLPMVMAKYESEVNGFDDVIFYNSRCKSITEGSSYNVFIVTRNEKIVTCPLGNEILGGCTRARIIDIIRKEGLQLEERYYSKEELFNAKEVFTTSAIKTITSVTKVVGNIINTATIGDITSLLKVKYTDFLKNCNE